MIKSFGDTYLFGMYEEYNKKILAFIMNSTEIDTESDAFADIMFDIKRQNIGVSIASVATSKNIKLLTGGTGLPAQFRVFAAKDLKGDKNTTKVYIDCHDIIKDEGGKYVCKDIDILIAHLISAMTTLIFHADPKRITMNTQLTTKGAAAYATMFTHIVDYVFKISINPELKCKCKYLTARFYLEYVLGLESESTISATARKVSGLSDQAERVIEIGCKEDSFKTITSFINTLNHILKIEFTLDILVDKWMFLFGPSTVFGIEFFPAFSAMLTDAYCGCYLNNQKTIEKLIGREMVDFTKTIFQIGANALNVH